MLDLASMTNEVFCTPVTPPVPQTSARIVVDEFGMVSLSNNLALAFSKKPVQLRFNKDRTSIQISHVESATDPFLHRFPKKWSKTSSKCAGIAQAKTNRISSDIS